MNFPDAHIHFRTANPYSIINAFSNINHYHSRGIHPWYIEVNYREQLEILEKDLLHAKCVALGEAGLDKLCNIDFDVQLRVFKSQIELSEKYQLPLIIHCVRASNELFQLRKVLNPAQPWIWHGFHKANLLKQTIELEIIPSFGEAILHNLSLQNELKKLESNQFLLETDTSYLTIESIYKSVAKLRNETKEILQREQLSNFASIFKLWQIG
jgi:TatD DNase family protein